MKRSSHGVSSGSFENLKYRAELRSKNERIPYQVSPGSGSGPACAGQSQPPLPQEAPLPTVLASRIVTSRPCWRR